MNVRDRLFERWLNAGDDRTFEEWCIWRRRCATEMRHQQQLARAFGRRMAASQPEPYASPRHYTNAYLQQVLAQQQGLYPKYEAGGRSVLGGLLRGVLG